MNQVIVKGSAIPVGIYTFDVNETVILAPDEHLVGKVIPPPEISAETLTAKGTDWMFLMDQDIVQLQEGISLEFQSAWRQGFLFYSIGNWRSAAELFHRAHSLLPYGDGPSECLLGYMKSLNLEPPSDWQGFRALDSK